MISRHFFVCNKAVRNYRNNQCMRCFESQMGEGKDGIVLYEISEGQE